MHPDRDRDPARTETAAVRFLLNPLATGIGRLPTPAAAWLGRRFGDLGFYSLPGRRRITVANIRHAFPELGAAECHRLARRSWQHLGLTFVELCALLARPLDDFLERVSVQGAEHVDGTMAKYGRALMLTAHVGNWELLAAARHLRPYSLSVIVRPLDAPGLNALADRLRRKAGVELIDKRRALRPVLTALAEGGMVAILLDQNASRREGVFVPFFGRLASTSRAVAVLALRTGAPIVPIFSRREAGGRHRVIIHPPLPVPANGDEDAVVELTARCTAAIERTIREAPEQWLWLHARWRTRPPDEGAVEAPSS